MQYRSDIDGLRAVAVLPVLLFHADIPGFSGGYVGVDVFFVISGFLITGIVHQEMTERRFSIVNFYERRIRRILPALMAMMLATVVITTALFMPRDHEDFAKSLVATSLSAANMLFWWQSGYFDGAAESKPMLHTWSLAVEEQFYVVFPLFLWLLHRWWPRQIRSALVIVAVMSLFGCIAALRFSPISGFYLTPMRAWELMIGSLLAIGALRPLPTVAARELVGWAGIAAIMIAVVSFDSQTPFPGYAALLPALGAGAIIYAGQNGGSSAGRFLSNRPLVWVGLISYSLYLWHWPLLVFAEYNNIDELSHDQALAVLGAAFVCAYLSWRYVERPFRGKSGLLGRRGIFAWAAGCTLAFVGLGGAILALQGLPQRFSAPVRTALAASESTTPRMTECSGRLERQLVPKPPCVFGTGERPIAFVWGDSHADALTGAFERLAADNKISLYYGVDASCPPVVGLGTDEACIAAGIRRLAFLRSKPEIEYVILAARWSVYTQGRAVDFGPAESNEKLPLLMGADGVRLALHAKVTEEAFAAGIQRTVGLLRAAGKRVILVYPIPEAGYNVPTTIARKILHGEEPASFTRPRAYFDRRHAHVTSVLDALPDGPDLIRVRPADMLCPGERCVVYADGFPLYYDDDHLSLEGARRLAPLFQPAFGTICRAGACRSASE